METNNLEKTEKVIEKITDDVKLDSVDGEVGNVGETDELVGDDNSEESITITKNDDGNKNFGADVEKLLSKQTVENEDTGNGGDTGSNEDTGNGGDTGSNEDTGNKDLEKETLRNEIFKTLKQNTFYNHFYCGRHLIEKENTSIESLTKFYEEFKYYGERNKDDKTLITKLKTLINM